MKKIPKNPNQLNMQAQYDFDIVEKDKYEHWKKMRFFESAKQSSNQPFSIILPPPNITGKLHLGHALNSYLQDTIIRFKKMKNYDVLWIPGMDHAGIATQIKIEEKLRLAKINSRILTSREMHDQAQIWKQSYQKIIRDQWAKLGLGLDYRHEVFTLDENLNEVVSNVFIKMYQENLIYRGKKAINWDPQMQTALSNIEVVNRDTPSQMHYFKYPLKNHANNFLIIGTTRPETMYSDVAIAINPRDNNLKHLIGQIALSPLTNRELPIIGDNYVAINKGSGAMKVSAHATADIDIILEHNLSIIECIDKHGKMNEQSGDLVGQDRFIARKIVVEKLKKTKFYERTEEIISPISYSERSGDVIEILVQPQWFVKVDSLTNQVINHLNSDDRVHFHPERFHEVLKTWMENAHDWTISRQLWWGHRIPAWYKDEEIKVQLSSPGKGWKQDPDVLDTWFSSTLAPFSFLGWKDNETWKNDWRIRYFPTSLLVTGYDIIFFWVSRMYFQSLNLVHQKPFHDVLIHGLIRAEDGQKMSKSRNNGVDPMEVIASYGSDALRWFLLVNTTPGQDLTFSRDKIAAAWNLCNKIWNISRYIMEIMPRTYTNSLSNADEWILNQLAQLINQIGGDELDDSPQSLINKYEFTIIGKLLVDFIEEDFSSWYIEASKSAPNFGVATTVLENLMIILQPFLPFLSDYIYKQLTGQEVLKQMWPKIAITWRSDNHFWKLIIKVIKSIREFRVDNHLPATSPLQYWSDFTIPEVEQLIIQRLVHAELVENHDNLITIDGKQIFIKNNTQIKQNQMQLLQQKIVWLEKEIARAQALVTNQQFLNKANPTKIALEQKKLQQFVKDLKINKKHLQKLK